VNQFARPKQRKGWNDAIHTARSDLRKWIRKKGQKPLPETAIPALWNDNKVTFAQRGAIARLTVKDLFCIAQHGLCGYCATYLNSTGTGELDHYRPVRSITRWILAPGREVATDLSKAKGRKWRPHPPHRPGFWKEAYRWKNYVFACERCNGAWKRDLCLAELNGTPHLGPRDATETYLLLNPFDGDPSPHLEFDCIGGIRGKTKRGQATIDTCGLDRPSLIKDRLKSVQLAEEICDNIENARDATDRRKRYGRLLALGDWKSEYALVVRQTAERKLKKRWRDITLHAKK